MNDEECRAALDMHPGLLTDLGKISDLDEFLRRNFLVANADRALKKIADIRARLPHRSPQWLLDDLARLETAIAEFSPDLARWRDLVGVTEQTGRIA